MEGKLFRFSFQDQALKTKLFTGLVDGLLSRMAVRLDVINFNAGRKDFRVLVAV